MLMPAGRSTENRLKLRSQQFSFLHKSKDTRGVRIVRDNITNCDHQNDAQIQEKWIIVIEFYKLIVLALPVVVLHVHYLKQCYY